MMGEDVAVGLQGKLAVTLSTKSRDHFAILITLLPVICFFRFPILPSNKGMEHKWQPSLQRFSKVPL